MARAETQREAVQAALVEQRPTVAIEREQLLDLIEQTSSPPVQRPHVVPRERLRDRGPIRRAGDAELDADVSPLLVLGVIALLLVVFVAATQLR